MYYLRKVRLPVLVVAVVTVCAGCHKKAGGTAIAPPAPAVDTAPAMATTPPAGAPVPVDVKQSLAEANAALKSGEYERAAQNLLAVQQSQKQSQLTVQQAKQAYNQMAQLQGSLANAIANGDPGAKAAADLIRKSAMNR